MLTVLQVLTLLFLGVMLAWVVALGAAMALRQSDVVPPWAQALVNLLIAIWLAVAALWLAAAAIHALIDILAALAGGA